MAKKATTKSKKKAKTTSKTVVKNSKTKSIKTSKSTTKDSSIDFKEFFYGTIAAIAVYVLALWAIDSGSLWVYALTFAALYYAVHFYRLFIRNKFFNNDNSRKTKPAKS